TKRPSISRVYVTFCSMKRSSGMSFFILTSSLLVTDPFIRVGLVAGDNLNKSAGWITALNVNPLTARCISENEATRPVLVVRIVFNHFAGCDRLSDLLNTDSPENRLIHCVL